MLMRIAGKVLYRLFVEARWTVNTVKEVVLHPLSASYVDTKTGKFVARRPAFGKKGREWREANAHREAANSVQLDKLPSPEEVEELFSVMRVATLREMAAEILNGGIEHAKGNTDRLEYARLVNSWIATAEETVAAGRNLPGIVARRNVNAGGG